MDCNLSGQESPDNLPCSYEEWRGRDSQLIELWVIVVTLLMSLLGISGAWEKTNNSRVSDFCIIESLVV